MGGAKASGTGQGWRRSTIWPTEVAHVTEPINV